METETISKCCQVFGCKKKTTKVTEAGLCLCHKHAKPVSFPYRNPFTFTKRNAICPCQSGLKFKKCCHLVNIRPIKEEEVEVKESKDGSD